MKDKWWLAGINALERGRTEKRILFQKFSYETLVIKHFASGVAFAHHGIYPVPAIQVGPVVSPPFPHLYNGKFLMTSLQDGEQMPCKICIIIVNFKLWAIPLESTEWLTCGVSYSIVMAANNGKLAFWWIINLLLESLFNFPCGLGLSMTLSQVICLGVWCLTPSVCLNVPAKEARDCCWKCRLELQMSMYQEKKNTWKLQRRGKGLCLERETLPGSENWKKKKKNNPNQPNKKP